MKRKLVELFWAFVTLVAIAGFFYIFGSGILAVASP